MESFEEILIAGGHSNSLGRVGEVLQIVQGDYSRLDELFSCISDDDAWVRMRAIDTFEKIIKDQPNLVQPYLESIFSILTKSEQPSVQWHLAQIFSEVELTSDQQDQAITWLKTKIKTPDVDWIVAVNVMKSLLYFYRNEHVAASDLVRLFEAQESHASKTVRKKATEFLSDLAASASSS